MNQYPWNQQPYMFSSTYTNKYLSEFTMFDKNGWKCKIIMRTEIIDSVSERLGSNESICRLLLKQPYNGEDFVDVIGKFDDVKKIVFPEFYQKDNTEKK